MLTAMPVGLGCRGQNRREAEVAAAYAAQSQPSNAACTVRIYYSDDLRDVYSANLADDAQTSCSRRDVTRVRTARSTNPALLRTSWDG